MRVRKIECIAINVPLRKPYAISTGQVEYLEHVIVLSHLEDGSLGVGEAAPATVVSDEFAADVKLTVENFLAKCVEGQSIFDLERISSDMNRLIPGHTHAKSAVELSLWDAIGKTLETPLCDLIGGTVKSEVPVAWALGMGTEEGMVREAEEYVARGFKNLKVKIGTDSKKDLSNVSAIRRAVGDSVSIRVDANGGYTADQAVKTLRRMEEYDLELIEQPVPRWDVEGLARISKVLDTPVMADESLGSPEDAMRLVRCEAADVFNIKVAKLGIRASKKIAAIAESAGLTCSVGSMIESGVGTAAGAHFSASTSVVRYSTELVGTLLITDDIVKGSYRAEAGKIAVPRGNGLGVELSEEKLRKYRV